jgi:hypothetical protein
MDQVRMIIDKYSLQIPVEDVPGSFENATLNELYGDLLAQGIKSQLDALAAAAGYEEISIRDLERALSMTEAEDVLVVYQGLLAGSRKHLRSYVEDLKEHGIEYTSVYLSQEEFEKTVQL